MHSYREYLFHCVDNSEPVLADVYGRHHLAYPLRDRAGCAVAVVDLCMPSSRSLQPQQAHEIARALRLLTKAYHQISHVPDWQEEEGGGSTHCMPLTTHNLTTLQFRLSPPLCAALIPGGEPQRDTMLFDKLLLSDLRESVARLDKR